MEACSRVGLVGACSTSSAVTDNSPPAGRTRRPARAGAAVAVTRSSSLWAGYEFGEPACALESIPLKGTVTFAPLLPGPVKCGCEGVRGAWRSAAERRAPRRTPGVGGAGQAADPRLPKRSALRGALTNSGRLLRRFSSSRVALRGQGSPGSPLRPAPRPSTCGARLGERRAQRNGARAFSQPLDASDGYPTRFHVSPG